MKYSAIFSAVLAALSVSVNASPVALPESDVAIPNVEVTRAVADTSVEPLFRRTPEEKTAAYSDLEAAAAKAGKKLVAGQYYAFTVEWDLPAAVEGDAESKTELQQLQTQLGFEHIGVLVGTPTSTTTGKGKNLKTKLDFNGFIYHMIKKNASPGDTKMSFNTWKPMKGQTPKWNKDSSKAKADKIKKAGDDYVAEHKIYSTKTNNCNDFVKAMLAKL